MSLKDRTLLTLIKWVLYEMTFSVALRVDGGGSMTPLSINQSTKLAAWRSRSRIKMKVSTRKAVWMSRNRMPMAKAKILRLQHRPCFRGGPDMFRLVSLFGGSFKLAGKFINCHHTYSIQYRVFHEFSWFF